ncbi:Quinone oxidoreductase-like protein 2 [Araneus ventricosus]|uniref:Quinone oxidoreductase-like protein 2 n=1 Tax=Araneus ventricosus TaxID=182803 RepID=A0A4Y2DD10_ARAVE|nr:Quinone oxidoreductase-like protein 2 [Araneus ventricosus]
MRTALSKIVYYSKISSAVLPSFFSSSRDVASGCSRKYFSTKRILSPFLRDSESLKLNMEGDIIQKRWCHYKAAVLKEFGEKLEIAEKKRSAKVKETEVRIKVHCCAVNVADTLICSGKYDQEPKLPFTPGYEFSGEVLEIGSKVKNLSIGDKVIGLNKDTYSAMATECISEERVI